MAPQPDHRPIWRDFSREELVEFIDILLKEVLVFRRGDEAIAAMRARWAIAQRIAEGKRGPVAAALDHYLKARTAVAFNAYKSAARASERADAQAHAAFDALMAAYDEARS